MHLKKYFKNCLKWNNAKLSAFLRLEFVLCPRQEISRVLNHVKMANRSELLTATPRWSHPLLRPGPKLATFSFERRTLTDLMFHYMQRYKCTTFNYLMASYVHTMLPKSTYHIHRVSHSAWRKLHCKKIDVSGRNVLNCRHKKKTPRKTQNWFHRLQNFSLADPSDNRHHVHLRPSQQWQGLDTIRF